MTEVGLPAGATTTGQPGPRPMVSKPIAGCADARTDIPRGLASTAGRSADEKSLADASLLRADAASALTRLPHAADRNGRPRLTRLLREEHQLTACTERHTSPRARRPTDRDLLETALLHTASPAPAR